MNPDDIDNQAQFQRKTGSLPSDGERAFTWVFCLIYLSLMAAVIGVIVTLLITYLFNDVPKGLGFLLPFAVFGLLPHATKAVAATLVKTRGLPPLKRLGRMLATIHS